MAYYLQTDETVLPEPHTDSGSSAGERATNTSEIAPTPILPLLVFHTTKQSVTT